MKEYLTKLHISVTEYLTYSGDSSLKDFPRRNPEWPLRAWVGLQLEILQHKENGPVVSIVELQKIKRPRGRPRKVPIT